MAKRNRTNRPTVKDKQAVNEKVSHTRARQEAIKNSRRKVQTKEHILTQMATIQKQIDAMNDSFEFHDNIEESRYFDILLNFSLYQLLNIVYVLLYETESQKVEDRDQSTYFDIIADILHERK